MSTKLLFGSAFFILFIGAILFSNFGKVQQSASPVTSANKKMTALTYNLTRPYGKMERKEIGDRIIKLEGVLYVRFEEDSVGTVMNVFYKGVNETTLRKQIDQIGIDSDSEIEGYEYNKPKTESI